jgi:hypothetical protein
VPAVLVKQIKDMREGGGAIDFDKPLASDACLGIEDNVTHIGHGPIHSKRSADRDVKIADPSARDVDRVILERS